MGIRIEARFVAISDDGTEKTLAVQPLKMRGERLETPMTHTLESKDSKGNKVSNTFTASYANGFSTGRIGWYGDSITIPAGQLSKSYPTKVSGTWLMIQSPLCAIPKTGGGSAKTELATEAIDVL